MQFGGNSGEVERNHCRADFCIKVGASPKYRYLKKVLLELADKAYIHQIAYDEVMTPICAKGKRQKRCGGCLEKIQIFSTKASGRRLETPAGIIDL